MTQILRSLPDSCPGLFDISHSVKVVGVANKYNEPEGTEITRIPEYTTPGGPNSYHCSKVESSWTQGFFPGLIWLMHQRLSLLPSSLDPSIKADQLVKLGRKWESGFKHLRRPSPNHDQGFRFQLSYGRDLEETGNEDCVQVLIDASDSLVDRYDPEIGCIRSWDAIRMKGKSDIYRHDNPMEHYLVIIDNMMNLDMLYQVSEITGDKNYADLANRQAETSQRTHVRHDGTTFHVVNMKRDGSWEGMTAQGYSDPSCWSRGQAWGIYGFAQCALRTGNQSFVATSRQLADVFLSKLEKTGVPFWDFDAPRPGPYDASAATIAARGLQMLYQLLRKSDPRAAEHYLTAAFKLIEDTMRECGTGAAAFKGDNVEFGEGGWETILQHSTINNNENATRRLADHGLVYADYYFVEFGNEALKLKAELEKQ